MPSPAGNWRGRHEYGHPPYGMTQAICGVYCISSPSGNFYIGSSVNVKSRWSGHKADLRRGAHHCQPLQRAAEKYGLKALAFTLLAECPREDLRELEQLVIDVADPAYNSSRSTEEALTDLWQQPKFRQAGIERARQQAAEWRADPEWRKRQREGAARGLSASHKDPAFAEAHRQRSSRVLKEIVNTPAVKERAAQARRDYWNANPEAAKARNEAARAHMLALHADPEFKRRVSESARERMKAMRADPVLRAKHAAAAKARHARPVQCLETGRVFECLRDAAAWAGLSGTGHIPDVIKGKRPHAGGYRWQWSEPDTKP